jgi:hypothetical protein
MQTKLPFFGNKKEKENKAPKDLAVKASRIKSVWDYLMNPNNKTERYNFEAQYGKLPEKIQKLNQDQVLKLNMWANNVKEGENVIAKLTSGDTEFLTDVDPSAFDDIKGDQKIKSAKTTGNKVVKESLLKRYLELREDAFLMDYMDRYKDEVNEGGKNIYYDATTTADISYKGDWVAEGDMELTNDMGKDNWIDDEGRHAKMKLQKTAEYSIKLAKMLGDMDQLPAWVQEKIVKASDYMSTVYHYLDYEMSRSEDDLKQNMDNHITEAKKKLNEAPEDELESPTTKHPTPSLLAMTLKNLGLNGKTIDSVKVVQANIPTYKVNLLNGEGFYLHHTDENDPFTAVINHKDYDTNDLIGGLNDAKNAIYNLLTQDQFKGLGGDEEGGDLGGDLGSGEPPAEEPAEEPEA